MKPYITDEIIEPSGYVNPHSGIRGHISAPTQTASQWMDAFTANAKPAVARRKPAATDAAPGLTQDELLQLVIDLTPAKPAKRRAAVAKDSSSDSSTADLNALYAKLHRTNKR